MAEQECVVCTRAAYIFCEHCAELEDTGRPLNVRWYCTVLCREADKPTHQADCFSKNNKESLLKQAYRAGELAQVIFYAFMEYTWAYDMSRVVIVPDQQGEIKAIDVTRGPGNDNGPGGESTCEQHAGGWLYKIPPDLFKSMAERKAKRMLLADQHSIWMFMNMHFVVQVLFEDLIKDTQEDIKEVTHYLPPGTRRFVRHKDRFGRETKRQDMPYVDLDAENNLKGVYRITLKDGTRLALDLAGAQYDLAHKTVEPWLPYLQRSASSIKYRLPHLSHMNKHIAHMRYYKDTTHLTVVLEQLANVEAMLNASRCTPGFEIKYLLMGNDAHFLDCKHRLEAAVISCLKQIPAKIDSNDPRGIVRPINLRHPKVIEKMDEAAVGESVFFNFGEMKHFDWSKLSDMIKMPGGFITYAEKKKARNLLRYRCVYKLPGDWRLVFLGTTLPPPTVPKECVSENPMWKGKGKRN